MSAHRGAHLREMGDDADANAILESEEAMDEAAELPHDIQHDMDDGLQQQHSADSDATNEAMMRLFLRSLAEAQAADAASSSNGQQMTPFTIPPPEDDGDEDDEAVDGEAADESFLGWVRASMPSVGAVSGARMGYWGRVWGLRVGRLAWNVGTGAALLLLPFLLAAQSEEGKVAEANLLMQMEARVNWLEQNGGAGGAGAFGAMGMPGAGGMGGLPMAVPDTAPPGYIPPPMEASGIPPPGRY